MTKLFLIINLIFLPFMLIAESTPVNTSPGTIGGIINEIGEILADVLPILFILATILFIWGLVWYLTSTGKEDKQKEAKNLMIWGVIILFAMVAVWGLVNIFEKTFNVEEDKIPQIPGDIDF